MKESNTNSPDKANLYEKGLRIGCVSVMIVSTIGLIQELSNILSDFASHGQGGVSVDSVNKAIVLSVIAGIQFSAIKRLPE